MSELAKQLARLRLRDSHADAQFQTLHKGRASLLFDAKQAAAIDTATIYSAAVNGLMALENYDDRFCAYHETLLRPSSMDLNRQLLTKEENRDVDNQITDFLSMLAPFLKQEAAHQTLEYLIRKYSIHELNVDALLRSALPYHDTKIFARLVQISQIEDGMWAFLLPTKHSGTPPSRASLAARCREDNALLEEICKVTREVSLSSTDTLNTYALSGADHIISFFAAICVESLTHKPVEAQVRTLCTYLIEILSPDTAVHHHTHRQLCLATSMILTQLSKTARLSADVCKSLAISLCAHARSFVHAQDQGLFPLLALVQHQKMNVLPHKVAVALTEDIGWLTLGLEKASKLFDVTPTVIALARSLLKKIATTPESANSLVRLLQMPLWSERHVIEISRRILISASDGELGLKPVTKVMQAISQRHPNAIDSAVSSITQMQAETIATKRSREDTQYLGNDTAAIVVTDRVKRVLDTVRLIFTGPGAVHVPLDSGGRLSLLLAFHDTNSAIRGQALERLSEILSGGEEEMDYGPPGNHEVFAAARAAIELIDDEDADIVKRALNPELLTSLCQCGLADKIIEAVQSAFIKWSSRLERVPKRASSILAALLAAISNATLVQHAKAPYKIIATLIQNFPPPIMHLVVDRKPLPQMQLIHHKAVQCARSANIPFFSGLTSNEDLDSGRLYDDLSSALIDTLLNDENSEIMHVLKGVIKESQPASSSDAHNIIALLGSLSKHAGTILSDIRGQSNPKRKHKNDQSKVGKLSELLKIILVSLFPIISVKLVAEDRAEVERQRVKLRPVSHDTVIDVSADSIRENRYEFLIDTFCCLMRCLPLIGVTEELQIISSHTVPFNTPFESSDLLAVCLDVSLMLRRSECVKLIQNTLKHLFADPLTPLVRLTSCPPARDDLKLCSESLESILSSHVSKNAVADMSTKAIASSAMVVGEIPRARALQLLGAYIQATLKEDSTSAFLLSHISSIALSALYCLSSTSKTVRRAALLLVSAVPSESNLHGPLQVDAKLQEFDLSEMFASMEVSISGDFRVAVPQPPRNGLATFESLLELSAFITQRRLELERDSYGTMTLGLLRDYFTLNSRNSEENTDARQCVSTETQLSRSALRDHMLWHTCTLSNLEMQAMFLEVFRYSPSDILWPHAKYILAYTLSNTDNFNAADAKLRQKFLRSLTAVFFESVNNSCETTILWADDMLGFFCVVLHYSSTRESALDVITPAWGNKLSPDQLLAVVKTVFGLVLLGDSALGDKLTLAFGYLTTLLTTSWTLLKDECVGFLSTLAQYFPAVDSFSDETGEIMSTTGRNIEEEKLDVALTRLSTLLECLQLSSVSSADEKFNLSVFARPLFIILASVNALSVQEVMSAEYLKSVVMDQIAKSLKCVNGIFARPKRSKRIAESREKSLIREMQLLRMCNYDGTTAEHDIHEVVVSIQDAKTPEVRNCGLQLFSLLAIQSPWAIVDSITDIVALVSNCVVRTDNALGIPLLKQILQSTVSVMTTYGEDNPSLSLYRILRIFASSIDRVPVSRRIDILITIVELVGPESLPILIASLIIRGLKPSEILEEISEINADTQLIILSRHAAKKARRNLAPTAWEETAEMTSKLCLASRVPSQATALIVLLRIAQRVSIYMVETISDQLGSTLINELREVEERHETKARQKNRNNMRVAGYSVTVTPEVEILEDDESQRDTSNTTKDHFIFNVLDLCCDIEEHLTSIKSLGDSRAIGMAKYLLLLLEFVHGQLENRTYHQQLAQASGASARNIQQTFLVLCEEVLELLRIAGRLHSGDNRTLSLLSREVSSRCLDLLESIQRLLDLPSFMAIMQQLVRHSHSGVRKHALAMFNHKLEKSRSSAHEKLFMSMLTDLRAVVCERSESCDSIGDEASIHGYQDTVNRQSALLSIDILARRFGKKHKKEFLSILHDICSILQFQDTSPGLNPDVLASCFLCLATLSAVLGAAVFPKLPLYFPMMLDALESTLRIETGGASVLLQTAVLSAISSTCAYVPQFVHPYLPRVFGALLHPAILNSTDTNVLKAASDAFSLIRSGVAPRLLVPVLHDNSSSVMHLGHKAAITFFDFLKTVFAGMERETAVKFMNSCMNLVLVSLDYRRIHGSQDENTDLVDASACAAAVAFFLRLTENELRTLFLKLIHWKTAVSGSPDNGTAVDEEWRELARRVVFFKLGELLGNTLKNIFVPLFGYIWTDLRDELEVISESAHHLALTNPNTNRRTKQGIQVSTACAPHAHTYVTEQISLCRAILASLTSCFAHDTDGFTDSNKFEAVMPTVVATLGFRALFSLDDEYLQFVATSVTPCVTSLALCVGRDVLWKPLNHRVLMYTRDKGKCVRVAALNVLHKLFEQVGDDYLILLPECLPYLSELLEDSHKSVTNAATEVIKFIEDLSGEKLDDYLT